MTAEKKDEFIKVKQFCRKCGKMNTRPSRNGIFFKCRHCGEYNAGPRLLNQALDPPRPRRPTKKNTAPTGDSVPDIGESGAKAESPTKSKSALDKLLGR